MFALSAYVAPPQSKWTEAEWSVIQSLSLSKLKPATDLSNQYANNPTAATLGQQLFFDKRLSKNGNISCASCHDPDNYFTDGRTIALGQTIGKRNTPSLHGVAHNTWFFWDGRKDSLWSQALAPFENQAEHNFPRTRVVQLVLSDTHYARLYTRVFGKADISHPVALPHDARPSGSIKQIKAWKQLSGTQKNQINEAFANVGKALAAFVTTLRPLNSRFDDYVAAYTAGDRDTNALNAQELVGLRLFIDRKTQCINCHSGPLFTNQTFHNIGTGRPGKDSGRAAALDKLRFDHFNCIGQYSDTPKEQCKELKFLQRDRHGLWGAFKTPTLRNISNTAPYFHDGRSQTLAEVIEHYTEADATKTHLQPLSLSAPEKNALLAFLQALSANE